MDKKELKQTGINLLKITGGGIATSVAANIIKQVTKGGFKSIKTMKLSDITKP